MEPFKNKFSTGLVHCFGHHLARQIDGFPRTRFEMEILDGLEPLELKQRARLIADATARHLPVDLETRFAILEAMLHPDTGDSFNWISDERGICGWGVMPLSMIVADCGLGDFDRSLCLLKEMTKRATAEFDVRPFLAADQERALEIMAPWTLDENVHVRRLVSEGTRPRLPWGMRLKRLVDDPSPVIPLLEALKDDPAEYVRRSVANHLNDIAKDHPALVADIASAWLKDASAERLKLVRHACRTLIKQGYQPALRAFGLNPPEISVPDFAAAQSTIRFGETLSFSAELLSTVPAPQDLVIDYVLHFRKANGRLAPKVFKWTKLTLAPGERRNLSRDHAIKPVTTRTYHGGTQAISLRINGQDFGYCEFVLQMPTAQ